MLTLGSLFDGIGGWQLAARRAGVTPVWSCEIDKFCCEVTRRHFPDTIQLGDVNFISDPPHVDIITAGSPCQDVSIAGKRSGINGSQSQLFFRATELVRRVNPQFFVWENVPGALNSNDGNDFRTVLEEILQESVPLPKHRSNAGLVDGRRCQIAWRILDAKFLGTPQRRRLIFLVADFAGRRAAKILFEPASVSGNSAPCTGERQNSAARTGKNFNSTIGQPLPQSTCYGIGRDAFNQGRNGKFALGIVRELQPPITARGPAACATPNFVRRLTPTECERLQGLPVDWTAGGSDAARYRALGNGMAQPCADFIIRRIKEVSI